MNWEGAYREGDTPWNIGEPAPPLMSLLETMDVSHANQATVLVPGCGLGHDADAWRRAGYKVTGLDISSTALNLAEKLYGNAIRWVKSDFLEEQDVLEDRVDIIFEHTCFCAIDPEKRGAYVQSASKWLVPGGLFIGIFFTDPPPRDDGESGPPFGSDLKDLRSIFGASFKIRRELSPDRSHPDRLGREVIIEMVRTP